MPVNVPALDYLAQLEWLVPRYLARARALLGWSNPDEQLMTRQGDAWPCPFCGMYSLRIRPLEGVIYCGNPACVDEDGQRIEWHGLEEAELLNDLLDDQAADTELDPAAAAGSREGGT